MAVPRITQQFVENIRGDTTFVAPNIRITQQHVESIRGDTAIISPKVRVTHQYVEIIRSIDIAISHVQVTQQFIEIISSNIVVVSGVDCTIEQQLPSLTQALTGGPFTAVNINQTLPYLEQTARFIITSPTIIYLPSASTLHEGGKRWRYRFYVATTAGLWIIAQSGETIRIGADETLSGGTISCDQVGSFLELFAIDDRHVVAAIETPEGVWTIA